jgi:hypothetical protein
MSTDHEQYPTALDDSDIDDLGHVIRTAFLQEGDDGYSNKIEVFRDDEDRGQIYQMWAIDRFAANPVALEAARTFGLAGDTVEKERWTQLIEHTAGVVAIAEHLRMLLEKHGAETPDRAELETAVLVHDIEKPAELAAAKAMAQDEDAEGLENSRDNPVLREGRLWTYLHDQGVSDAIILTAQNTGRSDRFFSDLGDYGGDAVKKALEDREGLARLLGVDRDVVDAMKPTERRRASIEAKGLAPALVGISDALAAQFKFQGISEADIDARSSRYSTYKRDAESVSFFGRDWPEYYKEVRRYLIDRVPGGNREAFRLELDTLTHETIFNETVLPEVLGPETMRRVADLHAAGKPSIYDRLRYADK